MTWLMLYGRRWSAHCSPYPYPDLITEQFGHLIDVSGVRSRVPNISGLIIGRVLSWLAILPYPLFITFRRGRLWVNLPSGWIIWPWQSEETLDMPSGNGQPNHLIFENVAMYRLHCCLHTRKWWEIILLFMPNQWIAVNNKVRVSS